MLTQERKDQLEAAYQANITAGRAPYAGVLISNTEELTWIYDQRNWSSRFWLEVDKSRADLTGARLTGADLTGARLTGARLTGARLTGADLTDADLTGADLTGADLTDADLTGADLTGAGLTGVKADIYDIVDQVPLDLPYLIDALKRGEVDGSCYRNDCKQGCLVGTLENAAAVRLNVSINDDSIELPKNSGRAAEKWFLAIRPGHMPENSQIVAWTVGILEERLAFYDRITAIWPKPAVTAAVEPVKE